MASAGDLIQIIATTRTDTGKQAAKKYRDNGLVPVIIYGLGKESRCVTVEEKEIAKHLHSGGGSELMEVRIDGSDAEPVVPLEVQRANITRTIIHIDLKRIDLKASDTFSVTIKVIGIAKGIRSGGLLNIVEDTIEVECLPTDIPHSLEVDVTLLDMGDALYARDLVMPANVTLITEPDQMIVNVVAPAAEKVVEAAPAEEEEAEEAPAEGAAKPTGKKSAKPED